MYRDQGCADKAGEILGSSTAGDEHGLDEQRLATWCRSIRGPFQGIQGMLRSGCANCINLARVPRQAIADLGIDAQFRRSPTTRPPSATASCPPPG